MGQEPRDPVVKQLTGQLAELRVARLWAAREDPIADLTMECRKLLVEEKLRSDIEQYLRGNPIIAQSLESALAQLAMVTGVRATDTPKVLQPLAHRGWHIGRWLPTFLLIDGPLGRILRDCASPISICLKKDPSSFPLLAEARDAFNHDIFRRVRNGFGHWSFYWRDEGVSSWIFIINWKTGKEDLKLSLLQAEAFHFMTAQVIEAIDKEVIRQVRSSGVG